MRVLIKILLLPVLIALIMGCEDLERTNPLDPKNENSIRGETVLIEAFVNESGGSLIESSVKALERLLGDYGNGSFIYLEHHIEKTSGTDPWALDASLSRYLALEPMQSAQALPDVWFNGDPDTRVQGASDTETCYQRYKPVLEAGLARQCYFTIEPEAHIQGSRIHISAEIAKLGSSRATDITVVVAILEQITTERTTVRNIVRAWVPVKTIGELDAGEITSFESDINIKTGWDDSRLTAVVIIHNSVDLLVNQCESVTL